MKFFAPLLALTLLVDPTNAAVIYYSTHAPNSNTIDVGASYANLFKVAKFNISLAMLTGATVKVIRIANTGSITVTNTGGITASIEALDDTFTAKQLTAGHDPYQPTVNLGNAIASESSGDKAVIVEFFGHL
jgi:hypothetical protein